MSTIIEGNGSGMAAGPAITGGIGATGRLVVGGMVSTGLVLGGYLVAGMTLTHQINAHALLVTSPGLFIAGAVAGLVVATALGLAGREENASVGMAAREVGKGALYGIPACAVGALLAGWIAMAIMSLYLGRILPIAMTLVAALIGLVVLAVTFRLTCDCCCNAVRRMQRRI